MNIARLDSFDTSLNFPGTVVNESSQSKPGDAVLGSQTATITSITNLNIKNMTFDAVLNLVKHLSLAEKLRLIKWIVPEIERELVVGPTPRKSLWGLCADLGIAPSATDIDEVRSEEWANFPREDF
ncbi:hypothetical protein [Microcoleus sp. A003_D6]|uniref:hypothetical protein n=1 Tax=Microcoleus sp. A003_D6 TaxID=3055266 RepID=UPI002FCE7D28